MAFSVEPTRVSRGSKGPIVALVAAAAVVIGAAVASEPARSAPTPAPSTNVASATASAVVIGVRDTAAPTWTPRIAGTWPPPPPVSVAVLLPSRIVRCHAIEAASCLRIANAAATALVVAGESFHAIDGVEVYRSLLCSDALVCPAPLLRRIVPLGSAVVSIRGDARDAWVNVGAPRAAPGPSVPDASPTPSGALRTGAAILDAPLEAWIVR